MYGKFKKGEMVLVLGFGQVDKKYYHNKSAIILERDPYFKDYHVKFKDGTCDWILPKFLQKPSERKKGA